MNDSSIAPLPESVAKTKRESKEEGSFLSFLVRLGVIVFVLRSFIFQPVSIPSESMVPRLLVGDYLVVAKWPYGYSTYSLWLPKSLRVMLGERAEYATSQGSGSRIVGSQPTRGDVVVFKAPPGNATDYIKRVIGLPGDMIQVRAGVLYINGTAVPKKRIADFVVAVSPNTSCANEESASDGTRRCRYPRFQETLPGGRTYNVLDTLDITYPSPDGIIADYTEVYSVPAGHVFVMGDNRDNSSDSRFPARDGGGVGIVPQENIVGRAWFTIFSTDGSASVMKPWTWFSAARWSRIGEGF
jgi:signal peptidase I